MWSPLTPSDEPLLASVIEEAQLATPSPIPSSRPYSGRTLVHGLSMGAARYIVTASLASMYPEHLRVAHGYPTGNREVCTLMHRARVPINPPHAGHKVDKQILRLVAADILRLNRCAVRRPKQSDYYLKDARFDAARTPRQVNRQPLKAHDPWLIDFALGRQRCPQVSRNLVPLQSPASQVRSRPVTYRCVCSTHPSLLMCSVSSTVICSGPYLGDPAAQLPISCKGWWPSHLLWQCSCGATPPPLLRAVAVQQRQSDCSLT
ncbi:hypothetical protein Purlil1_13505 [Purpureocillium lilacinum]|uniref:Uncharacterized protein n=1 Tax=Purpureocillium lilacinum TaxID=33203 RepID=A0ABR0BDX0_PURLI|nr:hypothetical protein Purlil1_13505 [Purpureocillium lilacinum]